MASVRTLSQVIPWRDHRPRIQTPQHRHYDKWLRYGMGILFLGIALLLVWGAFFGAAHMLANTAYMKSDGVANATPLGSMGLFFFFVAYMPLLIPAVLVPVVFFIAAVALSQKLAPAA